MIDLKAFRKANGIRQHELAEYLGIGQGFVSQMENGERRMPAAIEEKLLNNDRGWLVGAVRPAEPDTDCEISALREEINLLKRQVEELRADKVAYWALIEKLSNR